MRPTSGAAPAKRFIDVDELLTCVHCGLCQSACPTYVELGTEADSPRGRIHLMRALEEGRLEPSPEVVRHLDLCLGCRACETACPSGVQYGALIEAARPWVERHRSTPARLARRALARAVTTRWMRDAIFAPGCRRGAPGPATPRPSGDGGAAPCPRSWSPKEPCGGPRCW